MTRLDALRALEQKVAAGDIPDTGVDRFRAMPLRGGGAYADPNWYDAHAAYWKGSLDAAKALHEAVLHERTFVEFHWSKRYDDESRVTINLGSNGWHAGSSTPARAWLLAIIRALIAEGEG